MQADDNREMGAGAETGSGPPGAGAEEARAAQARPPPLPVESGLEFRPAGDGEFCRLDARVVNLWRLQAGISTVVLLFLGLMGGLLVAVQYRAALEWVVAAWMVLVLARTFYVFWYPPRAYRAWGYRIDARVLQTRQGIWFRVLTLLPLSRLQHVDLNRGPLERMLGLASLTLYTAGTHHSTVDIPGLDAAEAMRLRDQLVAWGGDDGV